MSKKVTVTFRYCTQCRWMLRTAWMAQELLSTFEHDIEEIRLIPDKGGVFKIHANGEEIWDRATNGGFPDVKELKQRVRDIIEPTRSLGHIDKKSNCPTCDSDESKTAVE